MSKSTENNVKKAPRFGVLDAVIILLVIIAVVGIYFRYNIIDLVTISKHLDDYTVSFSIDNIRYTTPEFVDVGDEVYFASDKEHFGTLTNVSENMGALSYIPASEEFITPSGEIIEVHYPDDRSRVSASGRLNCVGRYSDDGEFLVNGETYISCGQSVNVITELVTVTIRIDEINLASNE